MPFRVLLISALLWLPAALAHAGGGAAAAHLDEARAAVAKAASGRIVRAGVPDDVVATLSPADARRAATLVGRCEPTGSWSNTPPPWSEILVIVDDSGRPWPFRVLDRGVRVDRARPFDPDLSSIHTGAPTVADCDLDDDDAATLHDILRAHLGATRERAYASRHAAPDLRLLMPSEAAATAPPDKRESPALSARLRPPRRFATYDAIRVALAQDDLPQTLRAANGLILSTKAPKHRVSAAELQAAQAMLFCDALPCARSAFADLSAAAIAVIRRAPKRWKAAVVLTCPRDDQARPWVQFGDPVGNPYRGAKDRGCGAPVKAPSGPPPAH